MKICSKCNITSTDDKKFCKICGSALIESVTSSEKDSQEIPLQKNNPKESTLFKTDLTEYVRMANKNKKQKQGIILLAVGIIILFLTILKPLGIIAAIGLIGAGIFFAFIKM